MIHDIWYMIYDIWHMIYDIIYIYVYTWNICPVYWTCTTGDTCIFIYIYIYHIGFWRSFSPVPQLPQLPQSLHAAGHWSNRSHQVRGLVDLRSFTVWTPGRCHGWKPTRRWQSFSRRVGGMRLIELQLEQPDVEHVWQKPCAVHMIWFGDFFHMKHWDFWLAIAATVWITKRYSVPQLGRTVGHLEFVWTDSISCIQAQRRASLKICDSKSHGGWSFSQSFKRTFRVVFVFQLGNGYEMPSGNQTWPPIIDDFSIEMLGVSGFSS